MDTENKQLHTNRRCIIIDKEIWREIDFEIKNALSSSPNWKYVGNTGVKEW